jgi:hypothetical protein
MAMLWKLERASYTMLSESFKYGYGNGASLSLYGSSARETWREGSFTGDPEGYVKRGSGTTIFLQQGPRWLTMQWGLLYQGLYLKGVILFHQENLFTGDSKRYVKQCSVNEHLSP